MKASSRSPWRSRACSTATASFATAQQWVDRLEAAQHRNALEDELRRLERYELLVVDEIGYLPLERQAANLLLALVAAATNAARSSSPATAAKHTPDASM